MKELMQKALSTLGQRKAGSSHAARQKQDARTVKPQQDDDWGMSPEDALRVGTVARYK